MTIYYPPSYLLNPDWPQHTGDHMIKFQLKNQQAKSTIQHYGRSFIVTRPNGTTIKCHNRGTALWFVRNPQAK